MNRPPPFRRPYMNQGACPPQPASMPSAIPDGMECSVLPALRAAYYQLLAGAQTAEVRFGDYWQSFAKGDARLLQQEVRRLEILCGPLAGRGRAVRVGGNRPHPWPSGNHGYGW